MLRTFLLLILLQLNACNNVGTARLGEETTTETHTDSGFSGLTSISDKTDTSLTLNWTAHPNAVAYEVFNLQSGTPIYLMDVPGQASHSVSLTNLSPSTTYRFQVRMKTSSGSFSGHSTGIPVSTNSSPNAPSALSVVGTMLTTTPVIRISGVKSGDMVKLFTDSTCTTQVASGVASGTTIDLTSSILATGSYNFYANATNTGTTSSPCSTATVSYAVVTFAGITSVSSKTDTSITVNWTAHANAGSYDVYNTQSGTPILLVNVSGQASNSVTLTGLSPATAYKFRVRLKTPGGLYDDNTTDISATMNTSPEAPTGISMVGTVVSTTPTIRVTGVSAGNTVKLFTNNTCTAQVASGVASGTTIDLTSSALAVGNYNFYATATNSVPSSSVCSTATLAYTVFTFAGITSISGQTDSTITINWTAHASADSYDVYNAQSGTPVLITNVAGQASNSVTLTGLTPATAYKFRVRMKTAGGLYDSNTTEISTTMNAAPAAPSALSVVGTVITSTPTIRVSGVKSGNTVKLFTNSSCTTQVASGVASGTTIDLTTSALSSGNYNFYANSSNGVPNASACSTATVAYTVLSFAGATSVSNKTDTTVTVNWTAHASADSYDVYDTQSGTPILITNVAGQASNSLALTGLTPSSTYKFRVLLKTAAGFYDGNTNDVTATMNAAPNVPSGLSMVSTLLTTTPVVRVAGVKNGDTVKLFTDSSCTAQVASGTASGTTIDLTASALSAGSYNFYANATNAVPTASACSTATVAYSVVIFAGITSVSGKTDTNITVNWSAHASADSYDIYNTQSGTPVLLLNVPGQASNTATLTGLSPATAYKFRVRLKTSGGLYDDNTTDISATMNTSPEAPTGISMVGTVVSTTPTVTISGVSSGNTIKLFTDSSCTAQVASGVASGTTIDLTSSALAVGNYNFYATATNSVPSSSVCSTATLSYTVFTFAGITSISGQTDSTIAINWTAHASADSYDVYNTQSGTPVLITNVAGQASNTITLTGLTPGAAYKFRVRMKTAGGLYDSNTAEISTTLNSAPAAPSALSIVGTVISTTPTVRVSGVKSGNTIKLFTDSSCTTEVASGTASGTTIDLTTSALSLGNYNFYANSSNAVPAASACSAATVAYTVLSFAGITSISAKTDSTVTINWTAHASADSYDIYDTQSGTPAFITNVAGQASNSFALTGLTPSTAYKFRVLLKTAAGFYDANTNDIAATMNAAPNVPSGISVVGTVITTTPVIRVAGVKNGDTIKLFTDSSCSTQVASGVASGTTIDLTTSALALGNYNFYANASNAVPTASACSTATVAYTVLSFAGITSVSGKTDTTITINWTAHASADSYDIYNTQSGTPVLLTNVSGQASNTVSLTGLSPSTTYKFRVRLKTAAGMYDGNTAEISATMNTAPTAPSGLSVVGYVVTTTPVIRVAGVKNGDTIKLFTDSSCTAQVASGVASGTTIDLTSSALAVGNYNFYANATNATPTTSTCSSATLAYSVVSFAGISSVSGKTDTTITINWTAHASASSYDVYNNQSGSLVLLTNVSGQASNTVTLTGLTPSTPYKFQVRMVLASGLYDGNTAEISATLNAAPTVPSGLSLVTGLTSTPTVRVSGLKSGDTIRLFRDSSCATQVASGTASGSTIDLTSSALAVGAYTFYATASNATPTSSACSTASLSYVVCPTNFLPVSKNTGLGVSNAFCVAKYEMKNVGGVATSQAASVPWANIDQITAKSSCTALGTGYELMSNPEWMTIAHEIEATAANWTGGTVGNGTLTRGHSDGNPNMACDATVANVDTNCSTTSAVTDQKRTHTIASGGVIWDFAGNLWEWTNWALSSTLTSGPTTCPGGWTQLPSMSCADLPAATYLPANPAGITASTYNSVYNLGLIYGGPGSGAALRGGRWGNGGNAGIFALALDAASNNTYAEVGFRCVYHP